MPMKFLCKIKEMYMYKNSYIIKIYAQIKYEYCLKAYYLKESQKVVHKTNKQKIKRNKPRMSIK